MPFIMSGSILFIPPYTRGEKKPFGLSWNRTQVLLLHKQPLLPLDHGSSAKPVLLINLCSVDNFAKSFKLDLLKQVVLMSEAIADRLYWT